MPNGPVDLGKLRAYLRRLESGDIFVFLDRAIEELSPEALARVVEDYIDLDKIRTDDAVPKPLLAEVQAFHAAALRGEFYESFNVNSRNFRETSKGTNTFHAAFKRLLRRCLQSPRAGHEHEIRQALELLFDLMRKIDECRSDIVFYADEGGSWQLCVQWPAVFEAWCPCLAETANAGEYVAQVERLLADFIRSERPKVLEIARRCATEAQRLGLPVE